MTDEIARVERQIGLAPHADRQLANRPLVRQLDAVDRHGFRVALGRRRRDDADPDIAFDQPADGVEAAQLDPQFETTADPLGLFRQKALQRARSVQTDESRNRAPPRRRGVRLSPADGSAQRRARTGRRETARFRDQPSRPCRRQCRYRRCRRRSAATISSLSRSSRSMLTCGWAARKALSGSGRNSVSALVLDNSRICPRMPSAYCPRSLRMRSACCSRIRA